MNRTSSWPWSTSVLVGANVLVYVVGGPAADYPLAGSIDDVPRPTIAYLTFDVIRHPTTAAMVVTLAFFVPVAWATERALGAAGSVAVAATYVVAGFAAGFVEVLPVEAAAPVVGAHGATTGVIASWCITRWRHQHDPVLPMAVTVAWVVVGAQLYSSPPWLGASAAALVGLYAVDGLPLGRSTTRSGSGANRP